MPITSECLYVIVVVVILKMEVAVVVAVFEELFEYHVTRFLIMKKKKTKDERKLEKNVFLYVIL